MATIEASAASAVEMTYDTVPYPSYPFPQTHPDRLATIARLFSLNPTPVERCRVLELGCASGGNLLPMAATLPESTFLGIDRSGKQLAEGRKTIDALELRNIDLRQLDLADVDGEVGEFDYIICHGVYSWVPPAVQRRILQICRDCLAPQGVAYVSYNTLPGWNMRGTIRDMMCYHAAKFADPGQRVKQSRALLDFLAASVPAENNAYGQLLKSELETVRRSSDAYLFHDHLEQENNPCYFHELVAAAEAHELQYLGEADVKAMWSGNFGPDVRRTLRGVADGIIEMEQYMDFLRNRMFRQTLLCRKRLPIKRHIGPHSLKGMYVAANLAPQSSRHTPCTVTDSSHHAPRDESPLSRAASGDPAEKAKNNLPLSRAAGPEQTARESRPTDCCDLDVCSRDPATFQTPGGAQTNTPDPIMKAALLELHAAWPRSIQFETLLETCLGRVHANGVLDSRHVAQETEILANDLVKCYVSGVAEFCVSVSRFVTIVSERPNASAVARHQAEAGSVVTNLAHTSVKLDDFDRQVLRCLDGSRDMDAIIEALQQLVATGDLVIHELGRKLRPACEGQFQWGRCLAGALVRLSSFSVLVES